jgi:hypothetical protein
VLTDWWYDDQKTTSDILGDAIFGALFGILGTAAGRGATELMKADVTKKLMPSFLGLGNRPFDPAVPILLQNTTNPIPGRIGFGVEQGVSNIPSFVDRKGGNEK